MTRWPYGTTDILYSSNDVVVYSRQFYSKQVIVAINRQPDQSFTVPALNTTLPNGTYNDVLNGLLYGESATVSSGSSRASLSAAARSACGRITPISAPTLPE